MAAQSGNEGLRLPVPERSIVGKATSFGRPSGAFCQARIRGGLVDKDEPRQGFVEEPLSTVDPQVTRFGDLKSALLACLGAFFIAQPEPVQKSPYRGTLDFNAALRERNPQFVQSRFSTDRHPLADPIPMSQELRTTKRVVLLGGDQRTGLLMQDHHVVDEPRRTPEMPNGFTVAMPLIHKRNNTLTQLYRMRLAHGASPSMGKVKHTSSQTGIMNPVNGDTL